MFWRSAMKVDENIIVIDQLIDLLIDVTFKRKFDQVKMKNIIKIGQFTKIIDP